MQKNTKVCCFSGHRVIAPELVIHLPSLLDAKISSLIENGFTTFKAGGAVGFDTICALKALEMKRRYPEKNIRLELCLPCPEQAAFFKDSDKQIYSYVLSRADSICYAEKAYVSGCMFSRNRMLVNGSDLCIAYLSEKKGGTAYTVSYAKENGVEVLNLYDELTSLA
jgi:uncharacterized phage-like protein YoqJ